MLAETCVYTGCGQEVRYGTRDGQTGWWHRELVDHNPLFGVPSSQIDRAYIEAERHKVRDAFDKDGNAVTYTTAEYERKKMTKRTALTIDPDEQAEEEEEEGHDDIEPIEVRGMPCPEKGRLFIGTADGGVAVAEAPGGVRILLNAARRAGWAVERLSYARGPYLGASGKSLGVSDSVVLRVGVLIDGVRHQGVGSWRDGKSDWAWIVVDGQIDNVGAKALKNYIKEHPRGPST